MTAQRRWLGLLPALAIVAVPAGYAVVQGIGAGFGVGSPVAGTPVGLDAYRRVLGTDGFVSSAAFSLWVAAASTALAVAGGTTVAWWWTTRPGRLRTIDLWLVEVNLSLPHAAWAVGMAAVLAPSGWFSRLGHAVGLVEAPADFPILVGDRLGIGIIAHLASKEAAFVALATLPLASRRAQRAVAAAAVLGASGGQRFRLVFLPMVAPALVPAATVVFAFGLGGYEAPAVLGGQRPRTLAVVALDAFRASDLTRRADAFAISTMLAIVALGAAAALWAATRRWVTPQHRGTRATVPS